MQDCEVYLDVSTGGHLYCIQLDTVDLLVMVISSTYTVIHISRY